MTIAFGTIGAKTGGAPVLMPYPDGIAAGDLLIACRCTWNASANPTDQPGWTGVELSGGTGTSVDDHATRVRAEALEATGSESGTLSMEVSSGAQYGVMARYTRTGTAWDAITGTTGDDATHGADRAVTGSETVDLAPGDVLLAAVAVDTDDALTVTSPTFTATGITFGTVNRRTTGAGSGTGNDGNIEIFDAVVTAGSGTVIPSFAFTTPTSQCGPVAFLRLREIGAGGSAVNAGVAAVTLQAQPVTPTPQPVTITAGVAAATLQAQPVTPTPGQVTVAAQPVQATLQAQPVTPTPQPVTVAAGPAVMTLQAQPVSPQAAGTLALQPASLQLQAQPVTPVPQPVTVAAGPAQVTLQAQPVGVAAGTPSLQAAPAQLQLEARPVTPTPGVVTVTLVPVTLTLLAVPVQIPAGADYPVLVVAAVGRQAVGRAVGRNGRYHGAIATGKEPPL